DFLTVAEKDGSIGAALEGDSTSLGQFIDEMPNNLCLNITVVNESSGVLYSGASGCPEPVKYVIGRRTIVNNTVNYMAKLRVWYR
ncbi:MAG: hypothetical protein V1744_04970, partial [Candidatus Altiarchaeota archaeon]